MLAPILKNSGKRVGFRAAKQHTRRGGLLDVKPGWAMLRSRETPAGRKVMSLGIGALLTGVLVALELPIDAFVAVLLPFLGASVDLLVDGAEFLVLPILIACLLLPRMRDSRPTDSDRVLRSR